MIRLVFVTALVATLSAGPAWPTSSDARSYLCIGERATGFAYDKRTKRWSPANFTAHRYIVKKPVIGPYSPSGALNSAMAVYEFGQVDETTPLEFCEKDFNEIGCLFCSGWGDNFDFSRKTMKFIRSLAHGYIEPADQNIFEGATPFIEIGSCSAI
jgi:hypothetical protein